MVGCRRSTCTPFVGQADRLDRNIPPWAGGIALNMVAGGSSQCLIDDAIDQEKRRPLLRLIEYTQIIKRLWKSNGPGRVHRPVLLGPRTKD